MSVIVRKNSDPFRKYWWVILAIFGAIGAWACFPAVSSSGFSGLARNGFFLNGAGGLQPLDQSLAGVGDSGVQAPGGPIADGQSPAGAAGGGSAASGPMLYSPGPGSASAGKSTGSHAALADALSRADLYAGASAAPKTSFSMPQANFGAAGAGMPAGGGGGGFGGSQAGGGAFGAFGMPNSQISLGRARGLPSDLQALSPKGQAAGAMSSLQNAANQGLIAGQMGADAAQSSLASAGFDGGTVGPRIPGGAPNGSGAGAAISPSELTSPGQDFKQLPGAAPPAPVPPQGPSLKQKLLMMGLMMAMTGVMGAMMPGMKGMMGPMMMMQMMPMMMSMFMPSSAGSTGSSGGY